MYNLYQFFNAISQYKNVILIAVLLLVVLILTILFVNVIRHLQDLKEEQEEADKSAALRNMDYDALSKEQRAATLRHIVAPDGVDPATNSYFTINDGGRDIYIRSLTIVTMPKKDTFATTFATLLDTPQCTSSVFINPLSPAAMIRKMDKHITVLTSEYMAADGDVNRQRKLKAQYNDASQFAEEVENGENKFFSVGFVFSLYADDLRTLNKMTDTFRANAQAKNIVIANCYAVQAEAYAANAPLNHEQKTASMFIDTDAIKFFQMDKYSVSAIYNYTQSSYTHKEGIPLGRDLQSAAPIMFDVYDPSHDGFTIVIAGKTACGKSATIKMMASRQLTQGFHFVAVDSQARKGMSEGEYAGLAEMAGGVNFQISNSSHEIMNIFEVSETTKTVKDAADTVHEIRTLELSDKINMVANIIQTMVQGGSKKVDDLQTTTYIHRIIIDNLTAMYRSAGIIDGQPDSLYKVSDNITASGVSSGKTLKELPTLTDFYKQLLISRRDNTDPTLQNSYNVILMALEDYVRELYYSEKTCMWFDREGFLKLRLQEGGRGRECLNAQNKYEPVKEIHGIRAYYDGQSSVSISKDVPFTNIDISQLPDAEKGLARQVAIDFINENFIKKNSENVSSADKLECIFDEAHENFRNDYARATLDGAVRTARKRNVSIILSSQTVKEYDNYPETQAILKQAAVKFIFKQDYQDREYLMSTLGLTEAQANYIVNSLGGNPDDESDKNRHRGEMCIIDNKQVAFCKVDYLKDTESLPVETDARAIEALFNTKNNGGAGRKSA